MAEAVRGLDSAGETVGAVLGAGNDSMSQASLNIEMHEAILRTHAKSIEIRPDNTTKTYSGRHLEFKQWCSVKGFIDGCTVTGDKFHLFLEEQVIGGASRKRRKNSNDPVRTLGKATVFGYTSSIVELWRQQPAMKMNLHLSREIPTSRGS